MKAKITFNVTGHVIQVVEIIDPKLTLAKLQAGLNEGRIQTTIQATGTVDMTRNGKVVANVLSVDNRCEYEEFEVEKF